MSTGLDGVTVLVVEDNEDNRELLVFCLEEEEAVVKTAGSVAEARRALGVDVAKPWIPSVIVSDMSLPDGDGCEMLVALRKDPRFAAVPAIALTGRSDALVRSRGVAAGFQKHIIKPVDLIELVTSVASLANESAGAAVAPAKADGGADGKPSEGASARAKVLDEVHALAGRRDARGVLRLLNATTTHRYTAIFRFDGQRIASVWTYDREAPDADRFPTDVRLADSYCQYTRGRPEPLVVPDALEETLLVGHPAREEMRGYCGVALVRPDGTSFGSLCHYDPEPTPVSEDALRLLVEIARFLPDTLLAEASDRTSGVHATAAPST